MVVQIFFFNCLSLINDVPLVCGDVLVVLSLENINGRLISLQVWDEWSFFLIDAMVYELVWTSRLWGSDGFEIGR
jgi:hypothetical protein